MSKTKTNQKSGQISSQDDQVQDDRDDEDGVWEEAEGGVIACSDPGKPLHSPRYSF